MRYLARKFILGILILLFFNPVVSFSQQATIKQSSFSTAEKELYTAYNIWYEPGKETALWCINYKTGDMIPAGTEVKNVRITTAVSGKIFGGSTRAICFVTVEDGQEYYVNFNVKFHPGKTIEDYMDMMFTEKSFNEIAEGFSAVEIEGIRDGKVKIGMRKEAVLVSYGYPPEHRTPNTGDNVWTYWMNRFRSKEIYFDDDGRAIKPSKDPDEI